MDRAAAALEAYRVACLVVPFSPAIEREDIGSEVACRLLALDELPENVGGWAAIVGYRVWVDQIRKIRRHGFHLGAGDDPPAPEVDTVEELDQLGPMREALAQLPEHYRAALLDPAPSPAPGALKVRRVRARKMLRRIIG